MEKGAWNQKVIDYSGEFLQSWEWGEFQKSLGKKVERVEDDEFIAQIIFNNLPLGWNYAYIPRGPVFLSATNKNDVLNKVRREADNKTIFTELEFGQKSFNFKNLNFQTRQPLRTLILNINRDEEDIYSNFNKKLRYDIRKAKKEEFKIDKKSSPEILYRILKEVSREKKFNIWPLGYYERLYKTLSSGNMVEVWSVIDKGKEISSALFITFGERVTYLHAASTDKGYSLKASQWLHWQAIKDFSRRGFKEYDLWGIDEKKMPGVTRFKKEFKGEERRYLGRYIDVKKPFWYFVYKKAKNVI